MEKERNLYAIAKNSILEVANVKNLNLTYNDKLPMVKKSLVELFTVCKIDNRLVYLMYNKESLTIKELKFELSILEVLINAIKELGSEEEKEEAVEDEVEALLNLSFDIIDNSNIKELSELKERYKKAIELEEFLLNNTNELSKKVIIDSNLFLLNGRYSYIENFIKLRLEEEGVEAVVEVVVEEVRKHLLKIEVVEDTTELEATIESVNNIINSYMLSRIL